jgi:hypothetical protein
MTSAVGFTKPLAWSAGATQCHKNDAADGGVCGDLQTAKERALASVFPIISLCQPNKWYRLIGSYWKWNRLRIYPPASSKFRWWIPLTSQRVSVSALRIAASLGFRRWSCEPEEAARSATPLLFEGGPSNGQMGDVSPPGPPAPPPAAARLEDGQ